MTNANVLRLLSLAAIWGGSFIFIRVLAPELGPILTAGLRVFIGGLVLVAYFKAIRFGVEWARHWKHYLAIGIVNSALPFALYAYAALHIPASYSVILNSSSPLFGALFSVLWLGDRLTRGKIIGLVIGAGGVGLVARVRPVEVGQSFGLAVAACLLAAMCYALAAVYMKRFAKGTKPMAIAGASQLLAGVVLLPLTPTAPPMGELTGAVAANVLGLAVVCSAVAYLLYYRLIEEAGPTKALTVTFLMPLFGVVWGAVFLGERVTAVMVAGCALILIGTGFVVGLLGRANSPMDRSSKAR